MRLTPAIDLDKQSGAGDDSGTGLAFRVQLLCRAVGRHQAVTFRYGASPGLRKLAPHAVYAGTGGRIFVTGIQLSGRSGSGPRNFEVSRIAALTLLDERFKPGPPLKLAISKYQRGILCKI